MNNISQEKIRSRCLLLLNVGTPDSPNREDVKSYLKVFLNDPMVIDLPWLLRKILVNGIIIPFRVKTSVQIYENLWKKHGRILDTITNRLVIRLQKELEHDNIDVKYAMRYGKPTMSSVFEEIKKVGYKELIVFPMFPQYAMSTVKTIHTEVKKMMEYFELQKIPVRTVSPFFNNQYYIDAITSLAKNYNFSNYDYIIFSYHGLPNRHLKKAHMELNYPPPKYGKCCGDTGDFDCNVGCYKHECYETTRQVMASLGISNAKCTTAFQSRLSRNWMQPFCDELIIKKAKEGVKHILVFALSFTIDCLETVNEIGEEYREMFQKAGGETLDLVPALNDSQEMVNLTKILIKNNTTKLNSF